MRGETARKSTQGRRLRTSGLMATADQRVAATDWTEGGTHPHPNLAVADGFIDIGSSVGVAPMAEAHSSALHLMPMLQHALRTAAMPPAGTSMVSGPIDIEDVLVHLLSHLEPADLARSGAVCGFWRLAATRVALSSPWLSRTLGACGIQLQVVGGVGVTADVDYAALEPFHDGQPSGSGLRCLRAIAAAKVVVEYAGIALPACPVVGTYALGLEIEDVRSATDALMNNPDDYRLHPDLAEALRAWEEESLESLDPYEWRRLSRTNELACRLQHALPRALDARVFGNVSRFIKDEREAPNCAICWTTASILAGQPHAYVIALQDIAAGAELSIDYGEHYDRHWVPDGQPVFTLCDQSES